MNMAELAGAVSTDTGTPQSVAYPMLQSVLANIKEALLTEGTVKLSGFGTFTVKVLPAATKHNPRTGELINLPERKRIKFKVAPALTEALN